MMARRTSALADAHGCQGVAVGGDEDGVAGDGGGNEQGQHRDAGDQLHVESRRAAAGAAAEEARRPRGQPARLHGGAEGDGADQKEDDIAGKPARHVRHAEPGRQAEEQQHDQGGSPERDSLGDPEQGAGKGGAEDRLPERRQAVQRRRQARQREAGEGGGDPERRLGGILCT
jgi:hypothetical protein